MLGMIGVIRRRYLPDTLDDAGAVVPGGYDDEPGAASVQPAGADVLLLLPEGDRTRESRQLWTTAFDIRAADQHGSDAAQLGHRADRLRFEGAWWQVMSVQRWTRGRLAHYSAVVLRVQEGA